MAGHSKWANIIHRKTAQDAKKAKIFTKYARLIEISARQNPDIDSPALRLAIANAKSAGVPKDNIDRAIKKGSGLDKDGASIEHIIYEGYGPNGIAIIAEAYTDNRNRTASTVRTAFTKSGGAMGESGCASFQFDKLGKITAKNNKPEETFLELSIDSNSLDFYTLDEEAFFITRVEDLHQIKELLADKIDIISSDLFWHPNTTIESSDETKEKLARLIDVLEENEDITDVYHNAV